MTAVVIGAMTLVAAAIVLSFWMARWARSSHAELVAGEGERHTLRLRVDELTGHVQDRDRAIKDKTDELERERATRTLAQQHRDEALKLIDKLAAKSPAVISGAIRTQLERLRALAVPDVPVAADPAASAPADPR